MTPFFQILHQSKKSNARVGRIHTENGVIETPCFVAVGTHGTLKGIDNHLTDEMGLDLMFCNTYHLLLQPGTDVVRSAGGLHPFIQRKKPIITDSGGFQIFSLAYGGVADELKSKGQKKAKRTLLKVTEEGAIFRSYRDGKKIELTPELSIQAQKDLQSDIIIPLDELPPYHIDAYKLKQSFDRTHRWQKRSLDEHQKNTQNQHIYGVVHGGLNTALRKESIQTLEKQGFDGLAIGGSIGKTRKDLYELVEAITPSMSPERPRHLLGVADQISIPSLVPLGIDTFDSCYPTRAARHGYLFTKEGGIKLSKTSLREAHHAIEPDCKCPTCSTYTLSFLHHLFKAKEMTAVTLSSIHNTYFMIQMCKKIREMILADQI